MGRLRSGAVTAHLVVGGLLAGLLGAFPPLCAAQARVALVIGNEAYGGPVWSRLKTPHEDADAIAAKLREPGLGFDKVIKVPDAGYEAMWKALTDFRHELEARPGALAFFYFSGHGTFARGAKDASARNYMIPARSTLADEADASFKAVAVDDVVEVLESAEVSAGIVVVDACRDNGLARRKGSKGLGEQATRDGFIVAYAAREGRTAIDGEEGALSPYATALRNRLGEPGLRILDLFIEVRKDVMRATGNQQEPTQHVALNEHFSLVPGHATKTGPDASEAARLAAELAAMRQEIETLKRKPAEPPAPVAHPTLEVAQAPRAKPAPGAEMNALAGEFVRIPGGAFLLGCSPGNGKCEEGEKPAVRASVGPFWLGKHEVTVGQFRRFVAATGYRTDAERDTGEQGCGSERGYKSGLSWRAPSFTQGDDHPVVCVSLNDAEAYVGWLRKETGRGYRLATEAEWEFAARGGARSRYSWGDAVEAACRYGNVADRSVMAHYTDWWTANCTDGFVWTSPVGQFEANGYGLRDMTGNVWEWTCSSFAPYAEGQSGRCGNGDGLRVLRGGSWYTDPANLRVSFRSGITPAYRFNDLGFRLVQD